MRYFMKEILVRVGGRTVGGRAGRIGRFKNVAGMRKSRWDPSQPIIMQKVDDV